MNATNDIVTKLIADTTLISLLGITATDPKLYPVRAPQNAVEPYIVYSVISDGGMEEILKEFTVQLNVCGTYSQIQNIEKAIDAILDLQDRISITSSNYYFRWSKKVSGNDVYDELTDTNFRVLLYDFKLHSK